MALPVGQTTKIATWAVFKGDGEFASLDAAR